MSETRLSLLDRLETRKEKITGNDFPTWIFDDIENFDLGNRSKTILKKKVPYFRSRWALTGFSIHPEMGFAIIDDPIILSTETEYLVRFIVPHSVKHGETVVIQINFLNNTQSVMEPRFTFLNEHNDFEWAEINSHEENGNFIHIL